MAVRLQIQAIASEEISSQVEALIAKSETYSFVKTKIADSVPVPDTGVTPPADFEMYRFKSIGKRMLMGVCPDINDVLFFVSHDTDPSFWKKVPKKVKTYVDQVMVTELARTEPNEEGDIFDDDEGA